MTEGLRTPPNSTEAEQAVLGGLLLDNRAWDSIAGKLVETDFYRHDHRLLFAVLRELIEADHPADAITVAERLDSRKQLNDAGGLEYIGKLARETPSASNVASYARIITDRAKRRELIQVAGEVSALAFDAGEHSAESLVDHAQAKVMALTERISGMVKRAGDGLAGWLETLDRRFEAGGGLLGLSTGFPDLDDVLSGLESGSLYIVAGRPSMGKTTLAMNIAEHVALELAKPVLVYELEMTAAQLVDRLVASQGRVSLKALRAAQLEDHDWPKITHALEKLTAAPIYIDDTPGQSLGELTAKARAIKRQHGLGLIVVDYLQLMEGEGDTREQVISGISRGLKRLAKQLDVPVIALSQLNRAVEQRPNKRPVMSDLRESGSIEQDADVVVMMYRDEVYNPDTQDRGIAEAHVVKQRNGPLDTVRLMSRLHLTRFESLARDQQQQPAHAATTAKPAQDPPPHKLDRRELAAGERDQA